MCGSDLSPHISIIKSWQLSLTPVIQKAVKDAIRSDVAEKLNKLDIIIADLGQIKGNIAQHD